MIRILPLLEAYLKQLGPNPEPAFQRDFKRWVMRNPLVDVHALRQWVTDLTDHGVRWPVDADKPGINRLCDLVIQRFQEQDRPTAFGHLILTLTPCYHPDGGRWDEKNDPLRLPPVSIGQFYRDILEYLETQPKTRALLDKGPPAKGVLVFDEGAQMCQARAVAIPYDAFQSSAPPPVQPIFDPDEDCLASIQTAARACCTRLHEAGWGEFCTTILCGPFDFRATQVLADFSWLKRVRSLGNYLLVGLGLVLYFSTGLGGMGWLYGLNGFVWPMPRPFLWWGFGAACACLGGGLLGSLLWSGMRSVLPWRQASPGQPKKFYFLTFIERLKGEPYEGPVVDISFGLTFFCAFVGAAMRWQRRPPAWARRLRELMHMGRLVACAGLTNNGEDALQCVDVRPKLQVIQNDKHVTTVVFSLFNGGDILVEWSVKRRPKVTTEKWLQAQERSRRMQVFCFHSMQHLIAHALTPHRVHRGVLRAVMGLLLLAAFSTYDQPPSPLLFVEVYPKHGASRSGSQFHYPGTSMSFIGKLQPTEQLTVHLRITPPSLWPFALQVASDSKALFAQEEYGWALERQVWNAGSWLSGQSLTTTVEVHMRQGTSAVHVVVIVQDLLQRRSQRRLVFTVGPVP